MGQGASNGRNILKESAKTVLSRQKIPVEVPNVVPITSSPPISPPIFMPRHTGASKLSLEEEKSILSSADMLMNLARNAEVRRVSHIFLLFSD